MSSSGVLEIENPPLRISLKTTGLHPKNPLSHLLIAAQNLQSIFLLKKYFYSAITKKFIHLIRVYKIGVLGATLFSFNALAQTPFLLAQLSETKITMPSGESEASKKLNENLFRVGDVYSRVTKDNFTGYVTAQDTITVEKINNGLVYLRHSSGNYDVHTEDGALVEFTTSKGTFTLDPPEVRRIAVNFEVDQKWDSQTIETNAESNGSFTRSSSSKVVGIEELKVGDESIKTYKVETYTFSSGFTVKLQYWYQPGWGVPLKTTRQLHRHGAPAEWETIEVISRKRGDG